MTIKINTWFGVKLAIFEKFLWYNIGNHFIFYSQSAPELKKIIVFG